MVCRAVCADQPASIQRKNHGQVLQGDIVQKLVKPALQERRINGDHRMHALAGEPCGKGNRVLLGDADVEITFRVTLGETDHAGTLAHGGCDGDQFRIGSGHVAKPVAKDLGERWLAAGTIPGNSDLGLEFRNTVIERRISLGQFVSLSFASDDMQEARAMQLLQVLQRRDQRV